MGIGRRLFDLVRANVGHYLRSTPEVDAWHKPGSTSRRSYEPPPPPPERERRTSEIERCYRALELPYGSGREAIRHAHRSLLRRYHPDRFARDEARLADATRLTQELTRARDRLLEAIDTGEIVPTTP